MHLPQSQTSVWTILLIGLVSLADVTVTDRGPALGRRKVDLSKKEAKDIGLTRKEGIAPVKIEVTATPGAAEVAPVR